MSAPFQCRILEVCCEDTRPRELAEALDRAAAETESFVRENGPAWPTYRRTVFTEQAPEWAFVVLSDRELTELEARAVVDDDLLRQYDPEAAQCGACESDPCECAPDPEALSIREGR